MILLPCYDRTFEDHDEMAKTAAKKKGEGAPPRADGRKALLLYLHPEVTLALKKAALEVSKPAYEVAEGAIKEWLRRRK
ncbi:hypothetical protein [Bradyrhizobium canariense]|nr:hypothetical protein [Bradyrhizobium canariense]